MITTVENLHNTQNPPLGRRDGASFCKCLLTTVDFWLASDPTDVSAYI